jgi:hypothetical protein
MRKGLNILKISAGLGYMFHFKSPTNLDILLLFLGLNLTSYKPFHCYGIFRACYCSY